MVSSSLPPNDPQEGKGRNARQEPPWGDREDVVESQVARDAPVVWLEQQAREGEEVRTHGAGGQPQALSEQGGVDGARIQAQALPRDDRGEVAPEGEMEGRRCVHGLQGG